MTNNSYVKRIRIGQWNVRTLYQAGKFAELSREIERLNISICGLSEVRWNGSGEVRNRKGDVFIYSGMPNEDDVHARGVGILESCLRKNYHCNTKN